MSSQASNQLNLTRYSNEIEGVWRQKLTVGIGVREPHKLYNNFFNSQNFTNNFSKSHYNLRKYRESDIESLLHTYNYDRQYQVRLTKNNGVSIHLRSK